jgi:trimeric autotransporter adhesin
MATFTAAGLTAVDFTQFTISDFAAGIVTVSDAVTYRLSRGGDHDQFTGIFVYADGVLVGGSVFEWTRSIGGLDQFTISGMGLSVPTLQGFIASNNTAGFLAEIFSSDDEISGSLVGDHLLGFGGDDTMAGGFGNDTLEGGAGSDDLDGGIGADRMLGGAGNDDYIVNDAGDIVIEGAKQGDDDVESSVDFTLGANLEDLTLTGSASKGTGNALDNNIFGNAGNNLLSGLAGNDFLQAGGGKDTLQGGIGNDQYLLLTGDEDTKISEFANQGIDTVINGFDYTLEENLENLTLLFLAGAINGTGNALNNVITGNGFDNQLSGEAGNDTLISAGGKDTMFGGEGNDVYVVTSGDEVIGEGNSAGTDLVRAQTNYALTSFVENLTMEGPAAFNGTGNDLSNVIIGNTINNFLNGADGNDSVLGNDGDDGLSGGTGDDTLVGGTGNDNLSGGAGADKLIGGTGNDRYSIDDKDTITEAAGGGIDTISAGFNYTLGANFENLTVSLGNVGTGNGLANVIVSDFGSSTLIGGAGNDTLDGSQSDTVVGGTDSMAGGTGNDVYIIRASNNADTILTELLNQGIDRVESALDWFLGENFEDLLLRDNGGAIDGAGNALNNVITGNTSANKLFGNAGNDTLDGGNGGNDSLIGGVGDDTYIIRTGLETITESKDQGIDTVVTDIGYTLGANLENLTLTGDSQNGTGNALANKMVVLGSFSALLGEGGNDTLIGNGSNNAFVGGTGADQMAGGGGNDNYLVEDATDTVIEGANAGFDTVQTFVEDYVLSANLEMLALGSGVIKGTGNALGNEIGGNNLDNILIGLAGNDSIQGGGGGKDTLVGGTGDDFYSLGFFVDTEIQELANQGIDDVQVTVDYTLGDNLENLEVVGSASGTGNELNNLMTAFTTGMENKLFGLGGNDTLNGNGGKDTLSGGTGDDLYIIEDAAIEPGEESIVELVGQGTDSVQSEVSFTLDANVENLTLTGNNNISGGGNGLANILIGNTGNNNLFGGAGADKMMGGAGDDRYSVDDAKDLVIEGAKQGTDTVTATVNYTLGANLEDLWVNDGVIGIGNSGANKIAGLGGNNTLIGGAGNDTLDGSSADTVGGGIDSMAGGIGNDIYILRPGNEGSTLTEGANQGIDRVESSIDWTLGANFENLVLRQSGASINGTGNMLNNAITGNMFNNSLAGGAGNDTLDGGTAGADTLRGGVGNDLYLIHVGGVTVIEDLNQGIDSVKSDVNFGLGVNIENLTLTGTDDISGGGNNLANIIIGNGGDNFLNGGTGDDKMAGGAGNDTYVVDSGKDVVTEGANQGIDSVQSFVSLALGANLENLHLLAGANGTGNGLKNQITGNNSNNILSGLAGNDELEGGLGADTLLGGTGNDLLNGGGGADQINTVGGRDRVTYGATADAGDVIIGFAAKGADQDFVDLDALFDSLGVAAGRAARVSFVDTGADVELRIDTDGVGGADLTLLTFKGMASTADLTVGNGSTDDVLVGT